MRRSSGGGGGLFGAIHRGSESGRMRRLQEERQKFQEEQAVLNRIFRERASEAHDRHNEDMLNLRKSEFESRSKHQADLLKQNEARLKEMAKGHETTRKGQISTAYGRARSGGATQEGAISDAAVSTQATPEEQAQMQAILGGILKQRLQQADQAHQADMQARQQSPTVFTPGQSPDAMASQQPITPGQDIAGPLPMKAQAMAAKAQSMQKTDLGMQRTKQLMGATTADQQRKEHEQKMKDQAALIKRERDKATDARAEKHVQIALENLGLSKQRLQNEQLRTRMQQEMNAFHKMDANRNFGLRRERLTFEENQKREAQKKKIYDENKTWMTQVGKDRQQLRNMMNQMMERRDAKTATPAQRDDLDAQMRALRRAPDYVAIFGPPPDLPKGINQQQVDEYKQKYLMAPKDVGKALPVYHVFKAMLSSDPNEWQGLMDKAKVSPNGQKIMRFLAEDQVGQEGSPSAMYNQWLMMGPKKTSPDGSPQNPSKPKVGDRIEGTNVFLQNKDPYAPGYYPFSKAGTTESKPNPKAKQKPGKPASVHLDKLFEEALKAK